MKVGVYKHEVGTLLVAFSILTPHTGLDKFRRVLGPKIVFITAHKLLFLGGSSVALR
jgi:hypothetical protein